MADLRISIHGRNDRNTITEKKYPKFEEAATRLKPTGGSLASKNVRIVFESSAAGILFESIGWGRAHQPGDVEQAGILIGNYYKDSSAHDPVIWADVVTVVPADAALVNASFDNIDITTDAWKKMYDDAAEFDAENLQILGWYHTHLDHINTRFSGVDTKTQRKAFTYEYSFGVVLNPNQEKWSAFYGPDSRGCVGEIIYDEALEAKYGKPKITIRQVNGDSELHEDGAVVHLDEKDRTIENLPAEPNADARSFGRIVEQYYEGFGRLVTKFQRRLEAHRPSGGETQPPEPSATRVAAEEMRRVHAGASPKIEINNTAQEQPMIHGRYYTMSPDNRFMEQPRFKCAISKRDIGEIIRHRPECIEQNRYLWGDIRHTSSGMELTLVDEERANAKVVFSNYNSNREINATLAMGFQLSSSARIGFVVLVDGVNTQSVDVRLIHYSREYVI